MNTTGKQTPSSSTLQDIQDYAAARKAIDEGEESVPSEITFAILDGENPIKVWREYRDLTQQHVADAAGISKSYLSQIETGKRKGTAEVLAAMASGLGLTLDDILN